MNPSQRLKAVLKGVDVPSLVAFAAIAGTPPLAAKRAAKARSISVDAYLKLCAVVGIDPVSGVIVVPRPIGDFHPNSLGCAVKMVRIQRNETQRQFAKVAKLSAPTICRIERGEVVLIESILKICALMGRHPHNFVSPLHVKQSAETEHHLTP